MTIKIKRWAFCWAYIMKDFRAIYPKTYNIIIIFHHLFVTDLMPTFLRKLIFIIAQTCHFRDTLNNHMKKSERFTERDHRKTKIRGHGMSLDLEKHRTMPTKSVSPFQ